MALITEFLSRLERNGEWCRGGDGESLSGRKAENNRVCVGVKQHINENVDNINANPVNISPGQCVTET